MNGPAEVKVRAFSVEMRMLLGQFDVEVNWAERQIAAPSGRWRRTLPPLPRYKASRKAPPMVWVERVR
jgi:hypothetical protein